jgi:hypothetical protein
MTETKELLENVRLRLAEGDEARAAFDALKVRVETNEEIRNGELTEGINMLAKLYTARSYTVWTLMGVPAICGFTAGVLIALRWK